MSAKTEPTWEDFLEKKDELVAIVREMKESDRPPVVIFNYFGFRVDVTEEIYQN